MKRLLPLFFLCMLSLAAMATGVPKTMQVLIVSGGKFGDPNNYVRVGSYNPETGLYTVFDSIRAASTKSAIVSGGTLDYDAFVTADTVIVRYNMLTHTREAVSPSAKGLTYLEEYYPSSAQKWILATRGFGADSNYLHVYDAEHLSLLYTVKGISGQAAGIAVRGDTAYVAVPGSFGSTTGKIAVVDLKKMILNREIDLDTLGAGIDKLFGRVQFGKNNLIYAVSSKYNILIGLDPSTGAITTTQLPKDIGRAFDRDDNNIFLEVDDASLGEYVFSQQQFSSDTVIKYSNIPGVTASWDIAAIFSDEWAISQNEIYVSVTDFFSYGRVYVFNRAGKIVDTIETGISPEAIAFYREIVGGIEERRSSGLQVHLYPNPASSLVTCELPEISSGTCRILSITGQVIGHYEFDNTKTIKVNIRHLNKGMYFLQVNTDKGVGVTRFIRE